MTTHSRMAILRIMGNMEDAARKAADIGRTGAASTAANGSKVTGTQAGTIRGAAVSVAYTWSRNKNGRGVERWTWRMDDKRINSEALTSTLEALPVAVVAVSTAVAVTTPVHVPATAGNVARINMRGASHLYSMGTHRGTLECEANTRTQAARMAERFGYIVNDCNMIG